MSVEDVTVRVVSAAEKVVSVVCAVSIAFLSALASALMTFYVPP